MSGYLSTVQSHCNSIIQLWDGVGIRNLAKYCLLSGPSGVYSVDSKQGVSKCSTCRIPLDNNLVQDSAENILFNTRHWEVQLRYSSTGINRLGFVVIRHSFLKGHDRYVKTFLSLTQRRNTYSKSSWNDSHRLLQIQINMQWSSPNRSIWFALHPV